MTIVVDKKRRAGFLRFGVVLLLLAALCVGFVAVNNDAAQSADGGRLTVGLVNEDAAAAFNGEDYTFGTSFVDRISKDSDYNWVVLSRPVAEKAYQDGSVDAVLYIPQSFTADLLTLQELSPTKATIEYKLEHRADERADRLLESRIVGIVDRFNQNIVRMYYASLADNVADADGQMSSAISDQEALVEALMSEVQEPFSQTVPEVGSFIENASGLRGVNASTVETNNSFTKFAIDSLSQSGEALSGQLPNIDAYADLQRQIAGINAVNANRAIADQARADRDFYATQFDALKTSMLCSLAIPEGQQQGCMTASGVIAEPLSTLKDEVRRVLGQYDASNAEAAQSLRADLDARIRSLREVEGRLVGSPVGSDDSQDGDDPDDPAETPTVPVLPPSSPIVEDLRATIAALEDDRDSLSTTASTPRLERALANVDTWSAETATRVEEAALTAAAVASLTVDDWRAYRPDAVGLYVDGSDELRANVSGLVDQAAKTSEQIAGSAAAVPDNSDQFDALLRNADDASGRAEGVLREINDLVDLGGAGLEQNQTYYSNFSGLLANTRTQGADTSGIYDFFAVPITSKNVTPERPTASGGGVPSVIAPKWAAVFAIGLLAGVFSMMVGAVLRRKRASPQAM